jgi:exonuclease VII large subunit
MTESPRTLRDGLSRLRARARSSASEPSLKERIEELEAEMQETRRLNRRLAELMDVVEELLVPLSQRDEEKVQQYLSSHTTTL